MSNRSRSQSNDRTSVVSTPIVVACVCKRFEPSNNSTSDVRTGSLFGGIAATQRAVPRAPPLASNLDARGPTRGVATRRLVIISTPEPDRTLDRVSSARQRARASRERPTRSRASFLASFAPMRARAIATRTRRRVSMMDLATRRHDGVESSPGHRLRGGRARVGVLRYERARTLVVDSFESQRESLD